MNPIGLEIKPWEMGMELKLSRKPMFQWDPEDPRNPDFGSLMPPEPIGFLETVTVTHTCLSGIQSFLHGKDRLVMCLNCGQNFALPDRISLNTPLNHEVLASSGRDLA